MENLKSNDLEILIDEGEINKMSFSGRSHGTDSSNVLDLYFEKIVDSLEGKDLEMDFTKLVFINSSTVPPVIDLIKNLNNKSIKTKLIYDKKIGWQVASFKALYTISKSMEHITVVGV